MAHPSHARHASRAWSIMAWFDIDHIYFNYSIIIIAEEVSLLSYSTTQASHCHLCCHSGYLVDSTRRWNRNILCPFPALCYQSCKFLQSLAGCYFSALPFCTIDVTGYQPITSYFSRWPLLHKATPKILTRTLHTSTRLPSSHFWSHICPLGFVSENLTAANHWGLQYSQGWKCSF